MTEIYLQGTDVYDLVLTVRHDQPTGFLNRKLKVICNIIPSEVRVPGFFSRNLLIVVDWVGVSAYLHRRNILHRQYRTDYEFCEKLLLHLAAKLPNIPQEEEILELSGQYPSGHVNVQGFRDITHESTG